MTEKQRLAEIAAIAKDQLSHKTDLPRARRQRAGGSCKHGIKGNRHRYYDIPFDPYLFDKMTWSERSIIGSGMLADSGASDNVLWEDRYISW